MNLTELKLAKEIVEKKLEQARTTLSHYPLKDMKDLEKEVKVLKDSRNKADKLLLEQSILFIKEN